jgi:hypothetical protein
MGLEVKVWVGPGKYLVILQLSIHFRRSNYLCRRQVHANQHTHHLAHYDSSNAST